MSRVATVGDDRGVRESDFRRRRPRGRCWGCLPSSGGYAPAPADRRRRWCLAVISGYPEVIALNR
jgi:hypothetical protein